MTENSEYDRQDLPDAQGKNDFQVIGCTFGQIVGVDGYIRFCNITEAHQVIDKLDNISC